MALDWKNLTRAFVVGSSLPAFLVSFSYIGSAYLKKDKHPVRYEYLALAIPILLGMFNAASTLFSKPTLVSMILTGIMFGVFLSNVGTHIYDMPRKVFSFTDKNWYLPLILGPILYAFVWGVIIYGLNRLFDIQKSIKK